MQLNEEVWNEIDSTPSIPAESKKNLHVRIMRLIGQSQASPVGKKLGVTIMTQEESLAGDKQASNRNAAPLAGDPKPKSL